jgi:NAD(P)-dependent dehydrogenase (short-subunit alcohol dehydrogenase family)
MADHGWKVGIGARRVELLDELIADRKDADRWAAARLDVGDAGSVARWASTIRERLGEPDAVVNNAGWGIFAPVQETSEEDWDRTITTNLKGLYLVTRETLPMMLSRKRGHFVNILSVAARTAFANNTAYNASKYGALGFTEALREEVRGAGVRVTAILPGATDTPMWDTLEGEWDRSRMMRAGSVARVVREAIESAPDSLVEEIRIAPPLGNL